jgi:GNAT superfamily N-acetyltransferase
VEERVEIRRLARTELSRVGEIDRTEHIDLLYEQRGTELVERPGNWSASAWDPDGHGEHSVEAKRHELERYVDAGGMAFGAFVDGRLVGIGVVVPHLRPAVAQLAFVHVTQTLRGAGIGSRLSGELEQAAYGAGDSSMVVSATPSANTVRFYKGRGSRLRAHDPAAARAVRARARGCAHAESALRPTQAPRALPIGVITAMKLDHVIILIDGENVRHIQPRMSACNVKPATPV